jgi:hypothetical protein
MKKTLHSLLSVILALTIIVSITACGETVETDALWEHAIYEENTTFGNGAKTITVEVKAGEKSVTFTVHTDKDTVGAALFEHGLIDGDEGPFGLYMKVANGITADYDIDQSYWAFNVNGEPSPTGVDQTNLEEGATYQLVYTK